MYSHDMWQEGLCSVAKVIGKCQDKVYAQAAGPVPDGQASDQPDVAWKRCNLMLMLILKGVSS